MMGKHKTLDLKGISPKDFRKEPQKIIQVT